MSTLTIPANATEVGGTTIGSPPLVRRFQRLMAGLPRAQYNLWLYNDGSVTSTEPQAVYSGSVPTTLAGDNVKRFFQGGATHTLTAAEVTLLTTAGYGSIIT